MTTVLLVQSDVGLGNDWSRALASRGHDVLSAGGMTEGLARIREGGIDIIVVDSQRAGGELEEFVIQLGKLPDSPPFVLVSAAPHAPQVSARLGAAAFLPKPCDLEELDDVIDRMAPFKAIGTLDDIPTAPVDPDRKK